MGTVFSDLGVSADGYAAGLNQREEAPFGDIDENWLHAWMFETYEENRAEVDAIVDSGATIMGRNMFGPVRRWDRDWRGWWGRIRLRTGRAHPLPHDPSMEGGTSSTCHRRIHRPGAARAARHRSVAPRRSTSSSPRVSSTSCGCT